MMASPSLFGNVPNNVIVFSVSPRFRTSFNLNYDRSIINSKINSINSFIMFYNIKENGKIIYSFCLHFINFFPNFLFKKLTFYQACKKYTLEYRIKHYFKVIFYFINIYIFKWRKFFSPFFYLLSSKQTPSSD